MRSRRVLLCDLFEHDGRVYTPRREKARYV